MPYTFSCPACGGAISAEVAPNTQVTCPLCSQVVTVPSPTGPPVVGGPVPLQYGAGMSDPPSKGMAIGALVCGILGLFCLPVGLVGLILGIVALGKTKREPTRYGGRGLAIAGICTGAFGVVLGVIGILASFVIPHFMTTATRGGRSAQVGAGKALVHRSGSTGLALDLYRTHMGGYPEDLKVLLEKPTDADMARNWHGPYLDAPSGLKDPWGRELRYQMPGEHNPESYDLWSVGPDGQDGTDDDIGNW